MTPPAAAPITEDAGTFVRACPRGVLLGLDLGTRTIGIAVSDRTRTVATPRTTVRRRKFGTDAEAILGIARETGAVGIVLGLPRNMDGSEGPRAQSTRAFARNFLNVAGLPTLLWDERLSTVAAERALLEADMSRARRAEVIDQVAAGVILQGALDRLRQVALSGGGGDE